MAKSKEQKRVERKQRKAKIRAAQYAASAERKKQKRENAERNIKVNGYSFNRRNLILNQKKIEAKERQARWDNLTLQAKIAELKTRPGESKRQLARLNKLLADSRKANK